MSFLASAQEVRVDEGHILRAKLQNVNGDFVDAEFDLNSVIGASNGYFIWDGSDFTSSAENISFSIEQDGAIAVLRANIDDGSGNRQPREVNLGERIGNNDGSFAYN